LAAPLPSKAPVICGPTAGGKSWLAVELALALRDRHDIDAQVVTADAFQVYAGLNIGTAKPPPEERRGVEHHLIDIVPARSPQPFTLDRWLALARQTIADLRARGVLPIVVGGTHLYIKALLEGLFDGPKADPALRDALSAMDPGLRRAELERVDPAAAARIHPNDVRRTVRALEVYRLTGTPISQHQTQWDQAGAVAADEFQLVILDWDAPALNRRINARVQDMMSRGLLDEVRWLFDANAFTPQSAEALGYKQLIPIVCRAREEGRWPPAAGAVEKAVEQIKIETRRFGKNQRTWLRRLGTTPNAVRIAAETTPQEQWVDLVFDRLPLAIAEPPGGPPMGRSTKAAGEEL